MRIFTFVILLSIVLFSCKKDDSNVIVYEERFGEGMYIITDQGISFYNYLDTTAEVISQIYNFTNSAVIENPKKIKFKGTKAYILTDNSIIKTNVKTFEFLGIARGFLNPVDFDLIRPGDRMFVIDKDDAKVKEVDLERMEIVSEIETGDSTRPISIVSNSYRSFIMNGGQLANYAKDSTIIVIEYRDDLVPLANIIASVEVGYNPNSGVITTSGSGSLKVLCKGFYDPSMPSYNIESSVSSINQYTNEVYSTNILSGIYNAQNLIRNWNNSKCYFTAEGGVYRLNPNNLNVSAVSSINASVISTVVEANVINDSTTTYTEMLYMNDDNMPNYIYKYDLDQAVFVDTIIVDGNVRDINFY